MTVLAFDLGASSGRAVVAELRNDRLEMEEIHRFPNEPVQVGPYLHWDILRLLHEIKQGILKAKRWREGRGAGGAGSAGHAPASGGSGASRASGLRSLAIDSWAVDFGLLDRQGELLGNPYHYRDRQTEGMMEEVFAAVPREDIFARTGIQFMQINTLYHLAAMKKRGAAALREAETFLMIPDLLRYFLTGEKKCEFTNATTTQLFNPLTRSWDHELLDRLGLPARLFTAPVQPGTIVAPLTASVCDELGVAACPVVAVGEHDTASAVVAVPAAQRDFAYLICGTWSLLGTEVPEPVLTPQALAWNFTNEGGVGGTFRLLKNIMGLWLLQECRHAWEKEGASYTFAELVRLAEREPRFQALVDPDDPLFLNPAHMPEAIRSYCSRTGQAAPSTHGAVVRCVVESLALKYRYVLERTERLAGASYAGLHMVGGGINNALLCQFTANAIGRPVWAGPVEASAIGNVLVQLMALGEIAGLPEARQLVRDSFPVRTYEPQERDAWDEAYGRFIRLIGETV